jgi:hypothetical protein
MLDPCSTHLMNYPPLTLARTEQFDALVPQIFAILGLQPGVPQTTTHEGASLTLDPLTEKEVKDTLTGDGSLGPLVPTGTLHGRPNCSGRT